MIARTQITYMLFKPNFNRFHSRIKASPEVFSFYSNLISSALPLAALCAAIYFSINALRKTDTQNQSVTLQLKHAKDQLSLAQKQFGYSKGLHTEDSIASDKKEKRSEQRFIRNTLKQAKQERLEDKKERLQTLTNRQQFKLNEAQLKAVQAQAKTMGAQYLQQQEQYIQQQYEQRPVFYIDIVQIKHINDVKSTIEFAFSNKRIRSAHVDSTIIAIYNELQGCFSVKANASNLALIPHQNSLLTSNIKIYKACLDSKTTVYHIIIYNKDRVTGSNRVDPIFFIWQYNNRHQFLWSRVNGPAIKEFVNRLARKKILVLE